MANRYGDGGIKFAESQFARARKKQEDAQDLLKFFKALDFGISGANFFINREADNLENKQSFKKAAYQDLLTRVTNLRNSENQRITEGKSVVDYLTNTYLEKEKEKAKELFPNLDYSQYSAALYENARNLALETASEYEELMKKTNQFPSFDDNFDDYWSRSQDVPRDIFSWVTKKVKRSLGKETEDTMIAKQKEANPLYGTEAFKQFENLEKALIQYDTFTDKGIDTVKIIKDLNLQRGARIEDLSELKFFDRGNGNYTVVYYDAYKDPKTGKAVFKPIPLSSFFLPVSRESASPSDVESFLNIVKPKYRSNAAALLKTDNNIVTNEKLNEAYIEIASLGGIKEEGEGPDAADLDDILKAFESWYSIQIKNKKMVGPKGEEDFIAEDPDKDGIFTIKAGFRDIVLKEGLDDQTMLEKFKKDYFNTSFTPPTPEDADMQGSTLIVDYLDLKNPNALEEYNKLTERLKAPNIFGNKINAELNSRPETKSISLGMHKIDELFSKILTDEQIEKDQLDKKEYELFYNPQKNIFYYK